MTQVVLDCYFDSVGYQERFPSSPWDFSFHFFFFFLEPVVNKETHHMETHISGPKKLCLYWKSKQAIYFCSVMVINTIPLEEASSQLKAR